MANVFDNSKNLPHYTSRREAGIGQEEVLYQNNFIAQIICPPSIASGSELLTAQVTAVSGATTYQGSAAVEQTYRGATRSYASGVLESTVVDLTINFNLNINESNQLYVRDILKQWKKLIHDPETGRRGNKRDYVGQIVVDQYTRDGEIVLRTFYYDCWMTSAIPELTMDYTGGDIVNLDGIVFRSDYYTEETP